MAEHPYRDPAAPGSPKRAKARAWTVALVLVWIASVVLLFVGPLRWLALALVVGIPFIAANARVLSGASEDDRIN
jgi:hypothetical protein